MPKSRLKLIPGRVSQGRRKVEFACWTFLSENDDKAYSGALAAPGGSASGSGPSQPVSWECHLRFGSDRDPFRGPVAELRVVQSGREQLLPEMCKAEKATFQVGDGAKRTSDLDSPPQKTPGYQF
jgi:hypothetical protein